MNDSMKTKMEELITKFSTDKIKVSENLSIEHRDKYDARIYEEGFVDCYDLMSSEVEGLENTDCQCLYSITEVSSSLHIQCDRCAIISKLSNTEGG